MTDLKHGMPKLPAHPEQARYSEEFPGARDQLHLSLPAATSIRLPKRQKLPLRADTIEPDRARRGRVIDCHRPA